MFSANTSQVSNDVKYIEDFFSAWLRTGIGSSQTVTTGIKENTGALVISKSRSAATDWAWYDTFRGATKDLVSNSTAAQTTQSQGLTAFNTDGHTWGTLAKVNTSGATYVDFVLKPTPKFFDVVTYTGDGTTPRNIPHNLGSAPGCMIVKRTNTTGNWEVYHRSMPSGASRFMELNSTDGETPGTNRWASTAPTSTVFTVGDSAEVNASGSTYVAYLFAHNAGGFGLTGTDNVISCGSYTTDASGNATVDLGYEPQWILTKVASGGPTATNWFLFDNMRGMPVGSSDAILFPNTSGAEISIDRCDPTATGFNVKGLFASSTQIYIAIRRGPMKTPTSGTSVLALGTSTSDSSGYTLTSNFPVDSYLYGRRGGGSHGWMDRLRNARSFTPTTDAEGSTSGFVFWDSNVNVRRTGLLGSASTVDYALRRAPGFFDVVCYTGTGSATTVNHNLGVVPELMINKRRNSTLNWYVYSSMLGNNDGIWLNSANARRGIDDDYWNATTPTSTVFSLGAGNTNLSGSTYVQYLFASCPGVSKVGSYTGTGTTQQINCGFTAGARFVLIKRTDSTGDWYVWDSARGIVAGNDPYLLLNSTAAEVTSTDYIDPVSSGFEISSTAPAAINASGGSFIFFAVA